MVSDTFTVPFCQPFLDILTETEMCFLFGVLEGEGEGASGSYSPLFAIRGYSGHEVRRVGGPCSAGLVARPAAGRCGASKRKEP